MYDFLNKGDILGWKAFYINMLHIGGETSNLFSKTLVVILTQSSTKIYNAVWNQRPSNYISKSSI